MGNNFKSGFLKEFFQRETVGQLRVLLMRLEIIMVFPFIAMTKTFITLSLNI